MKVDGDIMEMQEEGVLRIEKPFRTSRPQ